MMQVIVAKNTEQNRKVLEQKKGIILVGSENSESEDKPKYLGSGLNSIMAKIAAKNSNFIGIDLTSMKDMQRGAKARILARIRQNIQICRNAGVRLAVRGADKPAFSALIESLGGSTRQASEAISF